VKAAEGRSVGGQVTVMDLPQDNSEYGKVEYWDQRYARYHTADHCCGSDFFFFFFFFSDPALTLILDPDCL
jgi:hypothetical protein